MVRAKEKEDIPMVSGGEGPFQRDSRTRKGEHDVALLYKIRERQVPGDDTP